MYMTLTAGAAAYSYTAEQAQISFQLSQDAYCGKDEYLSHVYEGAAEGFVATLVLDGFLYDV